MRHLPVKQNWLTRAVDTYNFHCNKVKLKDSWTLTDTADALGRSLGSVCEDITIANWLKSHRTQLEKFQFAKDALKFIREKKKRIITESIELD